jgi:hypothetical protein
LLKYSGLIEGPTKPKENPETRKISPWGLRNGEWNMQYLTSWMNVQSLSDLYKNRYWGILERFKYESKIRIAKKN